MIGDFYVKTQVEKNHGEEREFTTVKKLQWILQRFTMVTISYISSPFSFEEKVYLYWIIGLEADRMMTRLV